MSLVFVWRALRARERWLEEARAPGVLTVVAATAVLGERLTLLGERWAGYLLLVLALCLWLALLPRVLRHWTTPTVGVSFMLTVATESLAVLAAGSVTGIGGIGSFGRVWIWVALGVWTVVFAGLLRQAAAHVARR